MDSAFLDILGKIYSPEHQNILLSLCQSDTTDPKI